MTVADRFWAKVSRSDAGCWVWTAAKNSAGYGVFSIGGRLYLAHRVAYELAVGPIPEGLVIDHVRKRGCTSTLCVNPAHLEAVTDAENVMRTKRDHCPQGHPYSPENTYHRPSTGHRECRACNRARHRKAAR